MSNRFRIALLQKAADLHSSSDNLDTLCRAMKIAKENQADLLLPPECFLTGYRFPVANRDALDTQSPLLRSLCQAAAALEIGVVATGFSKGREKPRNTAWVIDKQGKILMQYHKVHTCDFADECCLEHGTEFRVCDFHGVKLGIMICYDREYPESARVLMLKGAEIILVPNDCGSMQPRLQALSTRAYENMVGVVMANPPGEEKGNSCAYSPICWDRDGHCVDNQILLADSHSQGIYYADFDLKELRRYRSQEMMGNTFRKVGAYEKLLDSEVAPPFCRSRQEECCKNGENPL